MLSSSVVQTCCGPVHAERKNDSNPVLAAAPLVWCCSLLTGVHVYEGRLLESVLYYGVFLSTVEPSAALRGVGNWVTPKPSVAVFLRFGFCSLLCLSCLSAAEAGGVSRRAAV